MKKFFRKKYLGLVLIFGTAGFIFLWGSNLVFKKLEPFRYTGLALEGVTQEKIKHPAHIATPDPVRGIYMTSWVASTRDWREKMVKLIDSTELNSLVIDIKDYTGRISFEVSDPDLQKIGSAERRIDDIKEFIDYLHSKNIYTIARISVFQDPYFVKIRPDLAVKTKSGAVWKDRKGLTWIDPCAKEYWDYIIKIAKKTEDVGFDELNFDYIRFASDGDMNNIVYPFCKPNVSKVDNLENFFKYLSENLKDSGVPLSADLFGMTTINTDDLNIGQVLERAAPYFNYICPMVYPSHYSPTFNDYKNPALYPYEIIFHAMASSSARLIAAGFTPFKLRPWLQNFDLGADYTAEMVRKEKQAVYDAGLNSWLLWDPANQYTPEALEF